MQPLVYLNKHRLSSTRVHQRNRSLDKRNIVLNIAELSSFGLRVEVHREKGLAESESVDVVLLAFRSCVQVGDHCFNGLAGVGGAKGFED